jgi:Flp pilus assembly protein TadB
MGSFLIVFLSPVRREQERLDALERGLPDALQIAGRQLGEGIPLETAIGRVGQRVSGPTAELFQSAATIQERLGTTVQAALSGEHGALAGTSSARAATVTTLLARAGKFGQPGGETVVAVGEYLERLQQVERDARRELAQTTSTLRQTAVLFAPIIAGVTVALATGMDAVETPGKAIDVALLGQVIGSYVLILGVILPGLAVILERGFDPVRIGYRSGIALATGSLLYPLAFLAARTLVYV